MSCTHEPRGHNGIHAVSIEIVLRAPFRRYACINHAIIINAFAPPTLFQELIKVVALPFNPQTLGYFMSHRTNKACRKPAILHQLGGNDCRHDKKTTEFSSARQFKSKIGLPRLAPNCEICTSSR